MHRCLRGALGIHILDKISLKLSSDGKQKYLDCRDTPRLSMESLQMLAVGKGACLSARSQPHDSKAEHPVIRAAPET